MDHYRRLESMYQHAPINDYYQPTMTIEEGKATISIELDAKMHHAAGGVHGSVYFKVLDDSAFFAASSLVEDVFVLTTSFTTYLVRPVAEGTMIATGTVVNASRNLIVAEAEVVDQNGKLLGRGSGTFMRGHTKLVDAAGYDIEL